MTCRAEPWSQFSAAASLVPWALFFLSKLPNIPPELSAQHRAMACQAFKTQQPLLKQKYSSSEAPVLHGCLQVEVLLRVASMPPSSCAGTAKPSAFQKMFLGIPRPCCWSIIHGKGREVAFSYNCKRLTKVWSAEEQKSSCALGEAGRACSVGWAHVWPNKK